MNFNKDNEQKLVNNRHKENTQATNCDRFYIEGVVTGTETGERWRSVTGPHWTLECHDGRINQSWLPVRSFDRCQDTAQTHICCNAHLHFILTVALIWGGLQVLIL